MGLKAKANSKEGGGDFEIPPRGTTPAVCVAVIDTGTHEESFGGKSWDSHKVYLVWELVEEKMSNTGGGNHVIGAEYTLSLNKKANLRKLIDGWRKEPLKDDEEFDLGLLKGAPCLININHKPSKDGTKTYAEVTGVQRPMKNQTIPKPQHEPFVYEIDEGGEPPALDWLPRIFGQKVEERVKDSNEWVEAHGRQKPTQQHAAGRRPHEETEAEESFEETSDQIPF